MLSIFKDKLDVQCKGRNGWFWPKGCNVTDIQLTEPKFLDISIESSRSIEGGDAPIAIRLSPADAQILVETIQASLREFAVTPAVTE